MKILFIGDVYAKPGREAVKKVLKGYRESLGVDLVIANVENIHHGKGVGMEDITEMQKAGVDFCTSGNHIWAERSIIPLLNDEKLPLIRPENYPPTVPGRGYQIVEISSGPHAGKKILVINLMGRVFMHMDLDCPFRAADAILEKFKNEKLDAIFVDFHAEATSEKVALANYLDGRITALVGTHTHVPTADERVLPNGTAYQSDAGMTGAVDSIIGADKKNIIEHFLTQMPVKHEVATGPTVFNAALIEVDDNGKAKKISRVQEYIK